MLTVPIWRVRATSAWDYDRARRLVNVTCPPIHCTTEDVFGFHNIIDGHHRWVACILRGDETILIEV
jgi:hypothetical protein